MSFIGIIYMNADQGLFTVVRVRYTTAENISSLLQQLLATYSSSDSGGLCDIKKWHPVFGCEFMSVGAMSSPDVRVPQHSTPSSGSCVLSVPSSMTFPES